MAVSSLEGYFVAYDNEESRVGWMKIDNCKLDEENNLATCMYYDGLVVPLGLFPPCNGMPFVAFVVNKKIKNNRKEKIRTCGTNILRMLL